MSVQTVFSAPTNYYCNVTTDQYQKYMNAYCQLWINLEGHLPTNKGFVIKAGTILWNQVPKKGKAILCNAVKTPTFSRLFCFKDGVLVFSSFGNSQLMAKEQTTLDKKLEEISISRQALKNLMKEAPALAKEIIQPQYNSLMREEMTLQHQKLKKQKHNASQRRYQERINLGLHVPQEGKGRKRKNPELPSIIQSIVEGCGVGAAHERRRTQDVVANSGLKELHDRVNN